MTCSGIILNAVQKQPVEVFHVSSVFRGVVGSRYAESGIPVAVFVSSCTHGMSPNTQDMDIS